MSRGIKTGSFDYSPRWTKTRVSEYLSDQFRILDGFVCPKDLQFPSLDGFAIKPTDQGTESAQAEFGTDVIQFGKGGLHGCSDGLANWERTVLNPITGRGIVDATTKGPPINWDLFIGGEETTIAVIMTPLEDGEESSSQRIKYPNKISLIEQIIRSNMSAVEITIQPYRRLHYRMKDGKYVGLDADQVDRSERGVTLFQYDGAGSYRLFYEAEVYQGGNPPGPQAGSAIPLGE